MQKWEYLILELSIGGGLLDLGKITYNYKIQGNTLSEKFISLGKDGWELVAIDKGPYGTTVTQASHRYFFKRPIEGKT